MSRPDGPNKRVLSWAYTNTRDIPTAIDKLNFNGPITAVTNWEAWYPGELKGRLPFQPMCHGKDRLGDPNWQNVEQNTSDSIIHFYNEPERASTSPEEAADMWRQHMIPLRQRNNKLVTPSCASDPAGTDWINRFMDLTRDAPPDFLGIHWYGENANDMKGFLQSMHDRHNIPICVTEWASIAKDGNAVVDFTIDMCNWMDGQDWIHQHALFGATAQPADGFVSQFAQLMNPDGSWTDLMYKYMYDQPMHR